MVETRLEPQYRSTVQRIIDEQADLRKLLLRVEAREDNVATEKTWAFTSPAGASGTFYYGGYYKFNTNPDDFSPSITFSGADVGRGAHFWVVLGAVTVDELTIRVTGTSITDAGVRTAADTQDIIIPSGTPVDTYFETTKKWNGQLTISVNAGTPKVCGYGYVKYWDNNNRDFVVRGVDVTWLGGANDANADIKLLHHKASGWTFNVGAASTPPTELASMSTDYTPEDEVRNGEEGAWKRTNLDTLINGNDGEGTIIEIVTSASKTFTTGNFLLRIEA